MPKRIFIPTGGSDADDAVFATALAVARPLSAHLGFYHSRPTVYEAAARSPPVQFCVGAALTSALATNKIAVSIAPTIDNEISAMLTQETDHSEERLLLNARHSDLVVLGRQRHIDRMRGAAASMR